MEKIYQMEYKGLNLFDEISTVELAIDEAQQTIHIFDVGQVVSPIFNFDVSAYELSDGFYQMADILRHKRILTNQQTASDITLSEWLIQNCAYFYSPKQRIKKYAQGSILEIIDRTKDLDLFDDYVQRI
ncbi:hypothetical protein I6G82_04145 [Lysinibacillus macroides]|uniref:Uncharacterized protein n=1 Tax=Lysinibacillus macroides TaxID=33935 RepID=A0A0M9DIR7_9BACI|nr:hypothetical protein [Lysinibacillus macroides]KOY81022.1 hypothetical protein ADM90_17835 [Lysinibacillus macroides]QPR68830.1 hypothetical protein I6G82_04145 [Lysinibacillus macroides]